MLLPTIGFLLSIYFTLIEYNYAPLLRKLLLLWVNWRLMVLSFLPWVGIFLPCCKLCWCVFGKLNLRLLFDYFSGSGLPKGERPRSYYLHAFCLCALARYFLVQQLYCVDLRMCMVAFELKRGNSVGLILAYTRNGWDAFQRRESSFFAGSPLLLQVWSLNFA